MARSSRTQLQVLTANRLVDGEVVYATRQGWTEVFTEAEVFRAREAADKRMKAAQSDLRARRIVEPYFFDVEETERGHRPVSVRETIRARGPTVRPDLGKQSAARNE